MIGICQVLADPQSSPARAVRLLALYLVPFLAGIGCFCSGARAQCVDPPPDVVSWWPAEESANDIVGTSHGIPVGGTTFSPGRVGQSFILDGSNDYVDFEDSVNTVSLPLTIEGWILLSESGGGSILESDYNSSNYAGFWFSINSSEQLVAGYGDGGSPASYNRRTFISQTPVTIDVWTHVAAVIEGPTVATLYIDGVDAGISTIDGSGGPMVHTADPGRLGIGFQGWIDELSLYDRALTESELSSIASAGAAGKCKSQNVCGNGVIDGAEDCEGGDVGGQTCETLGIGTGGIGCFASTCRFDTSGCTQNNCVPAPQELLVWWPGENNAQDIVTGDDATPVNGASFGAGFVDDAFKLDGVNQYLVAGNVLDGATLPFTVMAWIDFVGIGGRTILQSDKNDDRYYGFWFSLTGGNFLEVSYGDGGGPSPGNRRTKTAGTAIPTNTWTHVTAVVREARDISLYINGVKTGGAYHGSGSAMVHSLDPTWIDKFDGKIDELMVFGRGLTDEEVQSIVASGSAGVCKPERVCGNGILEAGEPCDGVQTGGQTCASLGHGVGEVECWDTGCVFNVSDCSSNPCSTAPSEILGWWAGNGNAADSWATNHGALQGSVSFVEGRVAEAFHFDSSSHIELGDVLNDLNVPFTVEAWLRVAPGGGGPILSVDDHSSNYYGMWFTVDGSRRVALSYGDGGSPAPYNRRTVESTLSIASDVWTHVAVAVHAPDDMRVFFNGSRVSGTQSGSGSSLAHSSDPARIGLHKNNRFLGDIDELTLHASALSHSEIRTLFNSGSAGKCRQETTCDDLDDNDNGIVDENCDDDGDGFCDSALETVGLPAVCPGGGGDCDDSAPTSFPGAPEICDGVDNDCDQQIDEEFLPTTTNCGVGACASAGVTICIGGTVEDNCTPGAPTTEICDLIDNDCDGFVDNAVDPTVDTDEDGLLDCWEVYGIDSDNPYGGKPDPIDVDLYIDGPPFFADRERRDLFVEIDYMGCGPTGCTDDPSHKPHDVALRRVENAFSDPAEATHPHIHLVLFVDEEMPHLDSIPNWGVFNFQIKMRPGYTWGTPVEDNICTGDAGGAHFGLAEVRALDLEECKPIMRAWSWVFRYAVFAHRGGGTGMALDCDSWHHQPQGTGLRCGTPDMLVGDGGVRRFSRLAADEWNTSFMVEHVDYQAATLMHELGHTLGLRHGGDESRNNCKPNYLSVMNYTRSFNSAGRADGHFLGLPKGTKWRTYRKLEYSSQEINITETLLDETPGLGSHDPDALTIFGCRAGCFPDRRIIGSASGPINWNYDSDASDLDLSLDVSDVPGNDGFIKCSTTNDGITALAGNNDWEDIVQYMALPDNPEAPVVVARSGYTGTNDVPFAFDEMSREGYLSAVLGSDDSDEDGIGNANDVCPLEPDPLQENADADEHGDACDCLPTDGTTWAGPSEALELGFISGDAMKWREPGYPGTTSIAYDTIRSIDPADFSSAFCVETNDGGDQEASDETVPSAGEVYYYLVRARNACPNGEGPLGTSSDGAMREGAVCP